MPYRSEAQRRWAHTPEGLAALGGEAAVEEWDAASKGKKLPEKKDEKEKKGEKKAEKKKGMTLAEALEEAKRRMKDGKAAG